MLIQLGLHNNTAKAYLRNKYSFTFKREKNLIPLFILLKKELINLFFPNIYSAIVIVNEFIGFA